MIGQSVGVETDCGVGDLVGHVRDPGFPGTVVQWANRLRRL